MKKYNVYPLISYTLFLSSFFVPVLGFFVSLFSGHFLLEFFFHKNKKLAYFYTLLFLITFILLYLYHALFTFIIIFPSVLFYKMFSRNYNHIKPGEVVIQKNGINPVSLSFIPILVFTLILLYGYNFDEKILAGIKLSIEKLNEYFTIKEIYKNNQFITNETNIRKIVNLLPSFISVYTILITYITIKLSAMARKYYIYFKMPDYYIPIFVVTGFLILFKNDVYMFIGINSLIIFGVLFLFQGIDILNYMLKTFLNNRNFIKIIIYVIMLTQLPCLILLTLVGIFDNWFNFMKYIKVKKT